jgi:protocatechuate 3,4-dioxygenase beta subunit
MANALNRREVLKSIGGAGVAAMFGARALDLLGGDAQAATTCLLTPEVTAGPYWVEEALTRRNVTEGKPGVPLVIRFKVLNAKTCKVIGNADVEIWHCDALGNYSAVNGATTR